MATNAAAANGSDMSASRPVRRNGVAVWDRPLYGVGIGTEGLDPREHAVTTVAVYSPTASIVLDDHDERRLIDQLFDWLHDQPPGIVTTWNGANFDGPFLDHRSLVLPPRPWRRAWRRRCPANIELRPDRAIAPKYEPLPGYGPNGYQIRWRWIHRHVDVAYLFRSWAESNGVPWSLKPGARAFGLRPVEVDRTQVAELPAADRMVCNLSDATVTYRLAEQAATLGLADHNGG